MQKFDPYINIDPGTMNPIQHGEVFVTDDGAETDLDLGHYERFIDESLTRNSNVTTGKVYWSVLEKKDMVISVEELFRLFRILLTRLKVVSTAVFQKKLKLLLLK